MEKDPLKIIGIALIVLGIFVIISAIPPIEQSFFPGADALVEKIPPVNATRIYIGLIISILGLIIYFGKEGLKILANK